jgi:DNA-directed RNA polymerase subunit RPC12/RpoP
MLQLKLKNFSLAGFCSRRHLATFYNIEGIMDESEDKIIVFESYDTVMSANLVKTKLDAYGIPCFLSDEHFVGLYPIRNELFPGVRLHIFEKDQERVKEILAEQKTVETEELRCPYCQSQNIKIITENQGILANMVTSVLLGLFLHPKKKYQCMDCTKEFESVSEDAKS